MMKLFIINTYENIDLILMDINLGKSKDGVETITEVKKIRDIPFLYLSGYRDDITLHRAIETRPLDFIYKPYSFKQLKISLKVAKVDLFLNKF